LLVGVLLVLGAMGVAPFIHPFQSTTGGPELPVLSQDATA
jgi:hypothetical protein